ncbi:MAG: VanZ family protein [Thermodesulfobacteriota bacterium]
MTYLKSPAVRQFCLYWLPPLAVTAGIIIFSGELGSTANTRPWVIWLLTWLPFLSFEDFAEGQGYLRKAGHVTAYATLSIFWFRACLWRFSLRRGAAMLCALALCLLIALVDEGHQALVPSRTGSLKDVALDFGAALLAALAFSFKRI